MLTLDANTFLYKRIADKVASAERHLINLLLLFDVVLTVANVLSRYLLHLKWSFTEEIVVALLVLMSLVGAALCAREKGGLIDMTIVTGRLAPRVQLVLDCVVTALLIAFGAIMVWSGAVRCMQQAASNQTTMTLQLPEWYYSAFVPIGGGLLCFHALEHLLDCICKWKIPVDKGGADV